MRLIVLSLMVLFANAVAPVAAQVPAPHVKLAKVALLPAPLPYPYDEKAEADRAVAKAFARAKASGKRVLVDMGGNWCPDCRILAGVMQLPEMARFLAAHYEIVMVDVGRFDENLQIPARFGIKKLVGVPTVVIAEPDGRTLNVSNSADLASAGEMRPQAIADWLARWAAPASRTLDVH
jgi:thiol-disulfide isomerase/thioredoxin